MGNLDDTESSDLQPSRSPSPIDRESIRKEKEWIRWNGPAKAQPKGVIKLNPWTTSECSIRYLRSSYLPMGPKVEVGSPSSFRRNFCIDWSNIILNYDHIQYLKEILLDLVCKGFKTSK